MQTTIEWNFAIQTVYFYNEDINTPNHLLLSKINSAKYAKEGTN